MSEIRRAYFIRTADESGGAGSGTNGTPPNGIPVQFNPASLQYGLQINNQQQGATPQSTQHVAQAEATLEMELLFDTTTGGQDVRNKSLPIRRLTASGDPAEQASAESAANRAPPQVAFVWGTFRFVGVLTGFRETLDFFSADGVPVRGTVRVSMKSTETSEVYAGPQADAAAAGLGSSLGFGGGGASGGADGGAGRGLGGGLGGGLGVGAGLSAGIGVGAGAGVSARLSAGFASAAAGRAVGAALGSESLRLPSVGGALKPVAGASAALGAGGLSATGGVSAGASVSAGAGFGFGGQAIGASAGVSASVSGSLRFTHSGGL